MDVEGMEERKGKEDEEEPQTPKQGDRLSPQRPRTLHPSTESEIKLWMDEVARVVGAKDGKDLADYRRWRTVAEQCVRAERFLPGFIDVLKAEFRRTRPEPQYFTPEGVLKVFQAGLANAPPAQSVRTQEEKLRDYQNQTFTR